jgi:hypothetical protein
MKSRIENGELKIQNARELPILNSQFSIFNSLYSPQAAGVLVEPAERRQQRQPHYLIRVMPA